MEYDMEQQNNQEPEVTTEHPKVDVEQVMKEAAELAKYVNKVETSMYYSLVLFLQLNGQAVDRTKNIIKLFKRCVAVDEQFLEVSEQLDIINICCAKKGLLRVVKFEQLSKAVEEMFLFLRKKIEPKMEKQEAVEVEAAEEKIVTT